MSRSKRLKTPLAWLLTSEGPAVASGNTRVFVTSESQSDFDNPQTTGRCTDSQARRTLLTKSKAHRRDTAVKVKLLLSPGKALTTHLITGDVASKEVSVVALAAALAERGGTRRSGGERRGRRPPSWSRRLRREHDAAVVAGWRPPSCSRARRARRGRDEAVERGAVSDRTYSKGLVFRALRKRTHAVSDRVYS